MFTDCPNRKRIETYLQSSSDCLNFGASGDMWANETCMGSSETVAFTEPGILEEISGEGLEDPFFLREDSLNEKALVDTIAKLVPDDKLQKRKLRNRKSARNHRQRQIKIRDGLEEALAKKDTEIRILSQRNSELIDAYERLRNIYEKHKSTLRYMDDMKLGIDTFRQKIMSKLPEVATKKDCMAVVTAQKNGDGHDKELQHFFNIDSITSLPSPRGSITSFLSPKEVSEFESGDLPCSTEVEHVVEPIDGSYDNDSTDTFTTCESSDQQLQFLHPCPDDMNAYQRAPGFNVPPYSFHSS